MDVHEQASATVVRWLSAVGVVAPAPEVRLAQLVAVPGGADFAKEIFNGVLRPRDARTVGHTLERLSHNIPAGIRRSTEFGTHISAGLASIAAGAAVSLAREAFLRHFSHLMLRLDVRELEAHLSELARRGGVRPVLTPIATSASGQHEANRHATDVRDLLLRDDVEAVSFRLTSVVANWRLVNLDGMVGEALDRVMSIFDLAANSQRPKAIELDVAHFDELEPTLLVFERMLQSYPELDVGIALPDSLPDSLPALRRVADAARKRRSRGGDRATVRIKREEHFLAERALAEGHGWKTAAFESSDDSRAHFLRMLDFALQPERCVSLRVISATHDPFLTAYAWRLAKERNVERSLEHEFRLGVASRLVDAVKRDVGGVRLSAPVLHTGRLSLATPYLVQRIEELAGPEGSLLTLTGPAPADVMERGQRRFAAAVEESRRPVVTSLRHQNAVRSEAADFTQPSTREWAYAVLERARDSAAGESLLAQSEQDDPAALEQLVSSAVSVGTVWGERRGSTRAEVLDSVADVFMEWRGHLAEVMVSESGILIEEADSDVTVAVSFARNAAREARALASTPDAAFVAPKLIVVVSPRSCAVTSLAGSVLAALAAGAAVIITTAPESRRTAAVFVESLVAAGVPSGLLTLVAGEGALARALLCDDRVERVLHAGSRHVAKQFHAWRAETALSSTTGGRNSVIVTPTADLDAAVADIVLGAFDHAGQAPTATGAVILVGTVGESARFLGRLADAVASVQAGSVGSAAAGVSALARPAETREIEALDTLAEGEKWRVRPRQLDEEGRHWSPGLRLGVHPEALFRRQERRAPVLDVVHVATFDEAIVAQNAPGFGLAAGVYSLDEVEVSTWLDAVEAGVLCVNRPVVNSVGSRVPLGGWGRSVLGTWRAPGGQDSVLSLGSWEAVDVRPGETVTLDGVGERVARFVAAAQPGMTFTEFDWVRVGARSDEAAWASAYSTRELTHFESERNVQRYRPLPVTIRLSEGAPLVHLVRVLASAALAGAPVAVSSATPLHPGMIALFGEHDSPVDVAEVLIESDTRWRARVQSREIVTERIRLIGGDPVVLARVLHGQPGIAVHAGSVTTSGRIELLAFLRAQSISVGIKRADSPGSDLRNLDLG